MKFYAVKNGRNCGVYSNWSDCEPQVKGYSNNQYRSFNSKADARAYVNSVSNTSESSASYMQTTGGNARSS
jgi:ribonuclease HI